MPACIKRNPRDNTVLAFCIKKTKTFIPTKFLEVFFVFFFFNQPTELSDLKLKCVDSRHTKHASCEMVIYIQQATDKTGLCRESGKLMSI